MAEQETLYLANHIHTMDSAIPGGDAILVRGEHIVAVGRRDEVESRAQGASRVTIDGTIVPGFNDCHCHILSYGLGLERLNVGAENARTIEDIKRAVAERGTQTAQGDWILGTGYNQNDLNERRHPTRSDLDEVSPDHPTVLWHASGHALTCNSRALELAGIDASTETPFGGDIDRDEGGEPTGVLFEDPAMSLLDRVIPTPTVEQGRDAILRAMESMAREGITSASDAATGEGEAIDLALAQYRGALASDRLAGRITLMPQIAYVAPAGEDGARSADDFTIGDTPDWLRIGQVKIFSDGALTTRTAAVFDSFEGSESLGLLIWDPETLSDMILRAHGAGWQIATHAIGDRAISTVLDAYEAALRVVPRPDHRHRIEHCMMVTENLAERIRDLGVIAIPQPGFIRRLGDGYLPALGLDRASQLMPMARFQRLGIPVGFSSDRPVIPGAPLDGIRAAVERTTPAGVVLGGEHRVSVLQAIRLFTVGSAFASRTETRTGTLAPGMLADFVALSHDPLSLPVDDLGELTVLRTVAGGRTTYEA